jgi:hypothetical protein
MEEDPEAEGPGREHPILEFWARAPWRPTFASTAHSFGPGQKSSYCFMLPALISGQPLSPFFAGSRAWESTPLP